MGRAIDLWRWEGRTGAAYHLEVVSAHARTTAAARAAVSRPAQLAAASRRAAPRLRGQPRAAQQLHARDGVVEDDGVAVGVDGELAAALHRVERRTPLGRDLLQWHGRVAVSAAVAAGGCGGRGRRVLWRCWR